MEVAASIGTELAVSGLSRVAKKLASNFGGDVTADEMEHLNLFVGYQIEALIREAKSDELLKSRPLLDKLQAVALELEDLLDLYEYNQIENQVRTSSPSNPIKKLISKSKQKLGTILPKSSLRIGLENLLKLVEQVQKIHPFIMSTKGTTHPQANTITPKTSTISSPFYGRGDQRDMIIELLLGESQADLNSKTKNVPIIAIRGLGGAGKTTTAQHIYNENRIENYFDLRMWVHVTHTFDEQSLLKEIIESAEKKECGQISNLDVLQEKLKDSISKKNKKFLLVLDDVWEKDIARLDILLITLNQVAEKGSRIILTTRTEKVAKDLNAKHIVLLDELKDEDCWSILKHYAFDCDEENMEDHQELKYVGNQIINKVKHSPLALKVVGSSLRNKRNASEWDKILQEENILKDTMNLLLFSYQCLPLHLQRCFAYCSLFPKGYEFFFNVTYSNPHLISLWIAQGYIESTDESILEKVGRNYIDELLSYSFFEKKSDYQFIIHDLLHDVAEEVSNKQCYRIEHHNSLLYVPSTCIHLSLCITKNMISKDQSTTLAISDILNLRNLRSLIVLKCPSYISIFESKRDVFQNLPKLRALYKGYLQREILSMDDRIDKLKHLRYLHVRSNSQLLVSVVKLYRLQFFILITDQEEGIGHLPANALPQDFSNLTNLRTLRFYDDNCEELDYLYYNSKMVNIEKLTSLQNLKKFHVDGFNGTKSLKDLPIGGSFSILNLENVKCKEEAEKAILSKKKDIDNLKFVWSSTTSSIDTCEQVLEGLEPHRNLERLRIEGYQGVKLPKWMVKENWLPRLQRLGLESCTSLKIVPFLPPRLLQLHVRDCDELIQLPLLSDTLLKLKLIRCPKLQALTNLSPTLTNLTIEDCPNMMQPSAFNKFPSFCDLSFLTSLEILSIKGFSNLDALNLCPISSWLLIEDCPKLTRLGNLQCCTSLRVLVIRKCPMLRREQASLVEGVAEGDTANRLPHVEEINTDDLILVLELVQQQAFSFVKHFNLTDCAAVQNLEMPSSLETLHIRDCPKLQALTNLSPTVTNLTIEDCPNMTQPSTFNKSPSFCDLSFLTRLESLCIKGFSNLDALNLCPISSRLWIEDCPKLTRLGNLQCCTSLRELEILKCPMLRREEASLVERAAEGDTANSIPHLEVINTDDLILVLELVQERAFSSIKRLILTDRAAVQNLEMFSSLKYLCIKDCPDVEYLSNLPVSLQELRIIRSPKLKEKYEKGYQICQFLCSTISDFPEFLSIQTIH